ncbi:DUF2513 domain-containing protein [uncultured Clostridium sp.]|uniref:DUF2513 domain-containing protein n=1 Tax=uncultured Clostridium sp. TaxID=59620 RepID=UPI0028E4B104|nr:DUF2513 domain-containing protein [uncultured Clostridium sp.]
MKLNPDCVRDILFTVEEHSTLDRGVNYPDEELEKLSDYSKDEILYHIKQCELSGLVTEVSWFLGGTCYISYLSPIGHEFLADIRSDTNWNKTKDVAKKVGSFSLSTLKDISAQVIAEVIKKSF